VKEKEKAIERLVANESAEQLAEQWLASYRREAVLENGDPEGFVERVRTVVEESPEETIAVAAFARFLELVALVDDTIL
jgi:hypothetical protein